MATITGTTINHGITIGTTGVYASPLTITSTGTVSATGTANAVYSTISNPALYNQGTVSATAVQSVGQGSGVLFKAGGSVGNAGTAGLIEGYYGVEIFGGGTVTNAATIDGSGDGGTGTGVAVAIRGGAGTVTNTGTILGSVIGVHLFQGGTIVDSGMIYGGNGSAVSFGGTGGNLLVLDPGYSLGGLVYGSTSAGATNTLELASASNAGTVSAALNTEFVSFGTVTVDGGARWTLSGNSTLGAGVTLSDLGTLTNTGSLTGAGRLVIDPASLVNSGFIGLDVTLAGGGYLDNQAGGTIAAAGTVVSGSGSAGTVSNSGTILSTSSSGASYGVRFSAGGSVSNTGTGLIEGHIGISISGTAGAVGNAATIIGNTYGVDLYAGGSVTNTGTGLIKGRFGGVYIGGTTGTVSNSATIIGVNFDNGVYLRAGGSVTNTGTGLIEGGVGGVYIGGTAGTVSNSATIIGASYGVNLIAGGTLVDSGMIAGSGGAVLFGGTGGNLLGLASGFALSGTVRGGAGATNTVALLGGAGAVTADYNSLGLINFGTIAFGAASGNSETWQITNVATLPGTIAGFIAVQDTVDLTGFLGGTLLNSGTVNGSDQLVVSNGSGTVTLQLDASDAMVFRAHTDGGIGTDIAVACYCRGTRVLTDRGEVAVEELAIGDMVVTLSGAARPVKWIGQRSYDGRFVAGNPAVLPIRIEAGALADGVPTRDLFVSPEHALYLGGTLVPAGLLANGATIHHVAGIERLEYFHIELETHDVIRAEGTPAESFVDCDNRFMFQNGAEYAALYPDDAPAPWEFCAPRLEETSPELQTIRATLLQRAEELGHTLDLDPDPDLHLIVDGAPIWPDSIAGERYRFRVPAGTAAVRLASRCAVPAEIEAASSDHRRLGVPVERIALSDGERSIAAWHDDAALSDGFQEDEGSHRWTDGLARLPEAWLRSFPGSFTIEIRLTRTGLGYRLPPPARSSAAA